MTSTVPDLPAGWRVLHTHGPLGFVTHAVLVRPDGSEVEWSSRRHRKGLGLRLAGVRAEGGRASAMSWWIGSLFAAWDALVAEQPVQRPAAKPDVWTSPAHAAAKSKARTGLGQ